MSSEKKVIAFIVEGPSDEAAIGSIMKEFFLKNEVQFVVVHGDITLQDYVSVDNILIKIDEQIEGIKRKYRYHTNDFVKIIHIVDTDGVYIPETSIIKSEDEPIQYFEDHIEASNVKGVIKRNESKGKILFKLRKTAKIHGIPYKIYFNSCNLEHVLYGELRNFSDEEKEILSDDFADRFEGKVEEFIAFVASPDIAVQGTYQQTWNYIQKDNHSLNRNSNMHLIFD